jgi:hypothetical protein
MQRNHLTGSLKEQIYNINMIVGLTKLVPVKHQHLPIGWLATVISSEATASAANRPLQVSTVTNWE